MILGSTFTIFLRSYFFNYQSWSNLDSIQRKWPNYVRLLPLVLIRTMRVIFFFFLFFSLLLYDYIQYFKIVLMEQLKGLISVQTKSVPLVEHFTEGCLSWWVCQLKNSNKKTYCDVTYIYGSPISTKLCWSGSINVNISWSINLLWQA